VVVVVDVVADVIVSEVGECCYVVQVVQWDLEGVGSDEEQDQDQVESLDLRGGQSILEAEGRMVRSLVRARNQPEEGDHSLDQTGQEEDRNRQSQGEGGIQEVRKENREVDHPAEGLDAKHSVWRDHSAWREAGKVATVPLPRS
jgi:hypothetical protein